MKTIENKWLSAIQDYILPLGFFFFLTGILFFNSMSAYHTQIYLFLLLPTLILLCFKFRDLKALFFSPAFQLLLLLFALFLFSLLWNDSTVNDIKQFKKTALILTFIVSLIYLHKHNNNIILQILLFSSSVYAIAGLYSIIDLYILQGSSLNSRIIGFGNLSNPLLSSHIYGVFCIFISMYYIASPKSINKSILLAAIFFSLLLFVLLTHSRTPLLGFIAVFIVFLWQSRSKKLVYFAAFMVLLSIVYIAIDFENITSRGLSSRPELWSLALQKIIQHPLLGHGAGSEILLYIESLDIVFSEPHNIHLGLTYYLGAVGLLIWLLFLSRLFIFFIRHKSSILAQCSGFMLLYGITSGLTEGGSIFTRPKEIWFLIWLPIALLLALETNNLVNKK